MPQKIISGTDLDDAITSDDILGKEVIDLAGVFIGVAEKLFIDNKSLDFIGISVDKGFLKKGLLIGKNYIDNVTKYAIFLNIRVAFEIKGMLVFDKNGKKIGKVKSIDLVGNKNEINGIYVSSELIKKHYLPSKLIEKIGNNIILNITKSDLFAMEKERTQLVK